MWDVFISYKSKNVDTARSIADRLISSGLNVWFAEYQILLVKRHRFQEAIDHGIRKSKYGIALTNDDYANSDYCGLEIKQLLRHCGPGRIFEIMIPEEPLTLQKYAQLHTAMRHLYTGDLDKTLQFIAEKTRWRILPGWESIADPVAKTFTGDCLGKPYHIDVSGWKMLERSFYGGGPCYVRQVEGNEIYWNLQYGEEFSPQVYEARFTLAQQNDRILYNTLLDYANHYFKDLMTGWQVSGIHLFFLMNSSHFAVTYTNQKIWKRRYSIILVHPQTGKAAEFLFTFEFEGNFKRYCWLTRIMDDLVKSLNWGDSMQSLPESLHKDKLKKPSQRDDRLSRVIDDQPLANKLNAEGLGYAKQGRLQEAIDTWKKVLDYSTLVELRGAVLFNLGRAYEKLGDEENALRCYKDSGEINPAQFNALCNIGSIYIKKGEYQVALDYLLAAVERNPQDSLTLNNLVVCYEKLGNYLEAEHWRNKQQDMKKT